MPSNLAARPLIALTLALAALGVGCKSPTPIGVLNEGKTAVPGRGTSAGQDLTLKPGSFFELTMRGPDGKLLDGVTVQVGGGLATVRGGKLMLSAATLEEGRTAGKLVIVGAGFQPVTLTFDGSTLPGDVTVSTIEGVGKTGLVGASGGLVTSASDRALVTIPTGFLTGGETPVSVGVYRPVLTGSAQADFERDVAALISARNAMAGGTGATAAGCGAPFPCTPVTGALGVSVAVNGPIQAGKMSVSLDLSAMLRGWDGTGTPPWEANPAAWTEAQRADALAAARITQTFAAFDASGDPTWRALMRDKYGITLDGKLLTFPVSVGDAATVDGLTRVEVDGLSVLGTRLEVTLLSAPSASSAAMSGMGDAQPISPGDVPLQLIQAKLPDYVNAPSLKTAGTSKITADNAPDAIFTQVSTTRNGITITDDDSPITITAAELLTNNGGQVMTNGTGALTLNGGTLLSNNAGGLVSNNAGGLVSNNAGGLVSNNAGGLIGNNVGGLVSNNAGGFLANNAAGLVPANSAGLIAGNTAGVITNNGSTLVSNNSGGILANNGSQLTGFPFFPFAPAAAK